MQHLGLSDKTITLDVDLIYPVGSIYLSVNSTSPATLFGGTWTQLGTDRDYYLVASSSGLGQAGSDAHSHSTSGHTLTSYEMPSHTHSIGRSNQGGGRTDWGLTGAGAHGGNVALNSGNGSMDVGWAGNSWSHTHGWTGASSHNPVYKTICVWYRTA